MVRRLPWLAAALALLLASCGGDEEPGAAPTPAGELPDLSGQSIEVAAIWVEPESTRFQDVIDEFESQTGATIKFTSTGDDIATVLRPRLRGGRPPDIAIVAQPALIAQWVEDDLLQPLDDFVSDELEANYSEDAAALGRVDGATYGVWFKAGNKSQVWYNADAFRDAGVSEPQDWDSFIEISQTLLDGTGTPPQSIGGGDGWTLTDWFENVYLQTAGSDMYDQLTRHEIPWTDESVTTALETLAELWSKKNLISGDPLQIDFNTSVTRVFSNPPRASLVEGQDAIAAIISGDTDAEVGTDAKFFPFPSIDGAPTSVVGGGDFVTMMKDNEAARAFVEFLARPEAANVRIPAGGFQSPNQNVDTSLYPDEVTRETAEALATAEQVRFDMSDLVPPAFGATTGAGMWKLFQDFLRDPSDVEGIQQKLERAAAQAFR